MIEALKPTGSDFWEDRWEVGDRERKDRKIWQVTYARIASNAPTFDRPMIDMSTLKRRLANTLEQIGDFARKQKMEHFASAFDAGLAQLNSECPGKDLYHTDLAPNGVLPIDAVQLLGAVQAAWVFGGMGSWNDVGFEGDDQILYEHLSENLFLSLNEAIVAAANANEGAGAGPPSSPQDRSRPWWKLWG